MCTRRHHKSHMLVVPRSPAAAVLVLRLVLMCTARGGPSCTHTSGVRGCTRPSKQAAATTLSHLLRFTGCEFRTKARIQAHGLRSDEQLMADRPVMVARQTGKAVALDFDESPVDRGRMGWSGAASVAAGRPWRIQRRVCPKIAENADVYSEH